MSLNGTQRIIVGDITKKKLKGKALKNALSAMNEMPKQKAKKK